MSEGKLDRRGFLAGAAGLTGVALSVGAWKPVFAMEAASAGVVRDLVPAVQKVGHISFTLDGAPAGFLSFAVGGNATSDVIEQKVEGELFTRKHIAGVKYEDITINFGTGMSKGFYDWIKSSFSGKTTPHSGAVGAADVNFKVFQTMDFRNALITEIGFPALDAASKDAAKMTLKFQPEFTRISTKVGGTIGSVPHVQEKWLVSNFKLTINGLNTSFVSKVDAINVKLDFAAGETTRLNQLVGINIPNLKIRIAEAHAQDFVSWHEDFVINGNNSPENEKIGSLSFLSNDLKTEFFRLDFSGLGIFALDPDPLTRDNTIRHTTAQLYCDKSIFNFKI